jgi:hypothetical protein
MCSVGAAVVLQLTRRLTGEDDGGTRRVGESLEHPTIMRRPLPCSIGA